MVIFVESLVRKMVCFRLVSVRGKLLWLALTSLQCDTLAWTVAAGRRDYGVDGQAEDVRPRVAFISNRNRQITYGR